MVGNILEELDDKDPALGKALRGVLHDLRIEVSRLPGSDTARVSSQQSGRGEVHNVTLDCGVLSVRAFCRYLGGLVSRDGAWEFASLLSGLAEDRGFAIRVIAESPDDPDRTGGSTYWSGIALEAHLSGADSLSPMAQGARLIPERLTLRLANTPAYSQLEGAFVLQARDTALKVAIAIPLLPGDGLAQLWLREPATLKDGLGGVTGILQAIFGPECRLASEDTKTLAFLEHVVVSDLSLSFQTLSSIVFGSLGLRSNTPLAIGTLSIANPQIYFGVTGASKSLEVVVSGDIRVGENLALSCRTRLPDGANAPWAVRCTGEIGSGSFPDLLDAVNVKGDPDLNSALGPDLLTNPLLKLSYLDLAFKGAGLEAYGFQIGIPGQFRFKSFSLVNCVFEVVKTSEGFSGQVEGQLVLQPDMPGSPPAGALRPSPAGGPVDEPLELWIEGGYGAGQWGISTSLRGTPRRLGYIWRCFGGREDGLGFLKDISLDSLSFSLAFGTHRQWMGEVIASSSGVSGCLQFEYGPEQSRIYGELGFGRTGKPVPEILKSFGIRSSPDCLADCVMQSISIRYHGGRNWRVTFTGEAKIGARTFRMDIAVQSGNTSITAKLVGKIGLGAFLDLLGQPAGTSGSDIALEGAGFRFSTSTTGSELQLVAAWSKGGRLGISTARRKRPDAGEKGGYSVPAKFVTVPSFVVEASGDGWLQKAHLLWSNADGTITFPSLSPGAERGWTATFMDGISGELAISLKSVIPAIADPVCIKRDDTGLRLRLDRAAAKGGKGDAIWEGQDVLFIPIARAKTAGAPPAGALKPPAGGPSAAPAKAPPPKPEEKKTDSKLKPSETLEKAGTPQAPQSAGSDKPGWICDKPISFGSVLDTVWPISSGAKPAWRQYAENALVLDRLGFEVGTKPLSVTFFSNATLNVGPWFSASVRRASLTVVPDGLAPDQLWTGKRSYDAEGAAVTLNIPPWLKAQAAVMRYREGESKAIDLALMGGGSIEIMEKLRIAALLYLGLKQRRLVEAFGFVSVAGISIGDPSFTVTGIAGGFGYNCVLELPGLPETVTDFSVVKLMRSDAPPQGANALFQQLEAFRKDLKSSSGAYCIAFGLTFRIAQLVDCLVLVVAEYRKPSLELSFVGLADFPLGAPKTGDTDVKPLGHLQLAIAGRFSSTSGTVRIIGKLTEKSWLFDESCRLTGSFAICLWFGEQNKGDFLVSLGGYSALVPTPSHYPALERVGFSWSPKEGMTLSGGLYVALDRVGVQFGCAARLNYETAALVVQASFAFDAVLFWSPMYFEARMRISAVVDVRKYITTRLTLDIDMEVWLPPFGARVNVKVSLFGLSYSTTLNVGAAKLPPKATFEEVLRLARGGEGDLIEVRCGSETPSTADKMPCLRSDEVRLDCRLAVPATYIDLKGRHWSTDELLDIRPMRATGFSSVVTLDLKDNAGKKQIDMSAWGLTPQLAVPTEALWFYPGSSQQDLARRSHRRAAASFRAECPQGPGGASVAVPVAGPRLTRDMPSDVAVAMPVSRLTRVAFAGTAFDLEGCV